MTSGASYAAAALPVGKPRRWSIAGGELIEEGRKTHSLPLASLTAARVVREQRGLGRRTLRLAFGRRLVTISSHSFDGPFRLRDQTAEFAAFARTLLEEAAARAPGARFETGAGRIGGIYLSAMGILAVGLALVVLATITAGALTMGLEIAARLAFVLILMAAIWPWIGRFEQRAFDPLAVPRTLLP